MAQKGADNPMKTNPSKKVVIINDVHSDTIEQAIFILRSAGEPQHGASSSGTHMVQEAQRVINAYVKTVEKARCGVKKQKKVRSGRDGALRRGVCAALALLAFVGAAVLVSRFYGSVLAVF